MWRSFERELGDAGFVEIAAGDHAVAIAVQADAETYATPRFMRAPALDGGNRRLVKNRRRLYRRALTPVALREGVLYVRVLQPALHYELEQISKPEILRKLKQRFGARTIRDVRFRVR